VPSEMFCLGTRERSEMARWIAGTSLAEVLDHLAIACAERSATLGGAAAEAWAMGRDIVLRAADDALELGL